MTDPLDHPDIHLLGERLGRQLEDILAAEQHAARVSAQRRTSLRDRLIRAEDMGLRVSLTTAIATIDGVVTAVGTDHLVIDRRHIVVLEHVVLLEVGE